MTGGTMPSNAARNNSLAKLWYSNALPPENRCPQYGCSVDWPSVEHITNGVWPQEALDVMHASGVQPQKALAVPV